METLDIFVRGGDGKLREYKRPDWDGDRNKPHVVFDSGWYDFKPSDPYKPLEEIRVKTPR